VLTYTPSYPSINSVGNAYQFIGKKMAEDTIQITKKEAHIISRCLWYFDNEADIMNASLSLNAHKEKGNKYEVDGFKKIIKLYQEQDKTHKKMSKKIEIFLHGAEEEEDE